MESTTTISEQDKAYFCRLNRNLVFSELIRYYAKKAEAEGLTQKKIADKLGMDHGQVCRLLSEPRNLTLDSVSKLLLAMGAQMNFDIEPIAVAPEVGEFMDEFASWYRRSQSLSVANIAYFVDRSTNAVKSADSATNPARFLNTIVGESDGRQAIG